MANELLDFVMGLVRDPAAAAQYAANPEQVIANAHLTGVTSADVNNLLPMVSESVAMSTPGVGPDLISAPSAAGLDSVLGNVWSSGAAHAAFEAFDAAAPGVTGFTPPAVHDTAAGVVDSGPAIDAPAADPGLAAALPDAFSQVADAVPVWAEQAVDHAPDPTFGTESDWAHPAADTHHVDPGHSGFDFFN